MSDKHFQTPGTISACTVADGDYFTGAAALVNSLHARGYRGIFWIGHRGPLPPWASNATPGAAWSELPVADGLAIRFVAIADGDTLALAKADFALRVLDELAPESDGLVFFDADIVVLADWSFFLDWLQAGVGLCTEMLPFKHANHPHRLYWRDMIGAIGRSARDIDLYFNSGFLAVPRQHRDVLLAWSTLIGEYRRRVGEPISGIRHGDRLDPLWATDQEMLNAAVMATSAPISVLGPEGMNFVPLSLYMSHATGQKPWRARYLVDAIAGRRPGPADRHFWQFAEKPIAALPAAATRRSRFLLKVASAIGRFYGRN